MIPFQHLLDQAWMRYSRFLCKKWILFNCGFLAKVTCASIAIKKIIEYCQNSHFLKQMRWLRWYKCCLKKEIFFNFSILTYLWMNPTWRRLDRQRNMRNGFPCPNWVGGGRRLKTKLLFQHKKIGLIEFRFLKREILLKLYVCLKA